MTVKPRSARGVRGPCPPSAWEPPPQEIVELDAIALEMTVNKADVGAVRAGR